MTIWEELTILRPLIGDVIFFILFSGYCIYFIKQNGYLCYLCYIVAIIDLFMAIWHAVDIINFMEKL